MIEAEQHVGGAGAGLQPAVHQLAGLRAGLETLVERAGRQLEAQLDAGDAAAAKALPAAGDTDIAQAAGVRVGYVGVALGNGVMRTDDERRLDVQAPIALRPVQPGGDVMVVGGLLDLAVRRQADRGPVDGAGA
jgi:hypothetical protein